MIVPRYWAEGRVQHVERSRERRRQITIRRFGWSDTSIGEAQQMADARAAEALEAVLAGRRRVQRMEPKVPYNGAEGVPIREEIIARQGETILTRNRYGALCLNTADTAFIDIDHRASTPPWFAALLLMAVFPFATHLAHPYPLTFRILWYIATTLLMLAVSGALWRRAVSLFGGESAMIRRRVERFFRRHPDLSGTLYETPGGYRLLLTQGPVDPNSPTLANWFRELRADREYVKMCSRQHCFRARVTPKPWRIGGAPLHHSVGAVWPLNPDQLAKREAWVIEYDQRRTGYAACRFVQTFGTAPEDAQVRQVQAWHDELSGARSGLPIA